MPTTFHSNTQALNHWQIKGKLAIKSPTFSGSARLHWTQQQDRYQIQLSGPLGQGAIRINGTANNVDLLKNGKIIAHANSAEALIKQQLGWQLPISLLYYWIQGIPAPDIAIDSQQYTEQQLVRLSQQEWSVEFLRYTSTDAGALPEKLTLKRDDIELHLVIRQWKLAP